MAWNSSHVRSGCDPAAWAARKTSSALKSNASAPLPRPALAWIRPPRIFENRSNTGSDWVGRLGPEKAIRSSTLIAGSMVRRRAVSDLDTLRLRAHFERLDITAGTKPISGLTIPSSGAGYKPVTACERAPTRALHPPWARPVKPRGR